MTYEQDGRIRLFRRPAVDWVAFFCTVRVFSVAKYDLSVLDETAPLESAC